MPFSVFFFFFYSRRIRISYSVQLWIYYSCKFHWCKIKKWKFRSFSKVIFLWTEISFRQSFQNKRWIIVISCRRSFRLIRNFFFIKNGISMAFTSMFVVWNLRMGETTSCKCHRGGGTDSVSAQMVSAEREGERESNTLEIISFRLSYAIRLPADSPYPKEPTKPVIFRKFRKRAFEETITLIK